MNSWTHLTSAVRFEMTKSKFNGEIWTITNLDKIDCLKWQKLTEIPVENIDTSEYDVLVNKKSKQILFFAKNIGVYSLQL